MHVFQASGSFSEPVPESTRLKLRLTLDRRAPVGASSGPDSATEHNQAQGTDARSHQA